VRRDSGGLRILVAPMKAEVSVGTSSAAPLLVHELANGFEERGYAVRRSTVEQRSVEVRPELITLYLVWKVAEPYADEFMREMARETVKALRTARDTARRRNRRLQAIVRLDAPPEPRPFVEYICGPDVPDDAIDMIEEDALTAPAPSRGFGIEMVAVGSRSPNSWRSKRVTAERSRPASVYSSSCRKASLPASGPAPRRPCRSAGTFRRYASRGGFAVGVECG
jgi:hypothetical protein